MLNIDILKQVLIIALASGCVTTLTIQKIKESLKNKKLLFIIGLCTSIIIGTLFAKTFSDASWIYCIWAGFFTWIDADVLYRILEDKVFTKFADIKKVTKIEREVVNEDIS